MKYKFLLLWLMLLMGAVNTHAQQAYAVLDGATLTFYYDNNKSRRPGTPYELNTENSCPKWYVNCSSVTSVVFDASFAGARPTSCYQWFCSMTNLTTITGIEYLKTDNVTNMGGMFQSCTGLTSLDVSGFNTSNVTDMTNMFYYCSSLSSLDVSGFKTANVTNMNNMFYSCFKLTSLDVSGFDTSKVTNMQGMFGSCTMLTSLDLSGFNTSKVTDMKGMFNNSYGLTSLDLSGFNTSNVSDMSSMFYGCSKLTSLNVSGFKTANVTNMQSMFRNCSLLENLDLSSFTFNFTSSSTSTRYFLQNCSRLKTLTIPSTAGNLYADACTGVGTFAPCTLIYPDGFTPEKTSEVDDWYQWKSGYFTDAREAYTVLNGSTLTFYCDKNKASRTGTKYKLNTGGGNLPGWKDNTSVTRVVFDASFANARPTNCFGWFYGLSNLTTITGIRYLNTDEVTVMKSMFLNCSRLSSLDVSGFNTSKVTDMSNMFSGCSGLSSLDVSGFNTEKVTDMTCMFRYCSGLLSLDLRSFTFSSGITSVNFLQNCSRLKTLTIPASAGNLNANACTGVGTQSAPCTLVNLSGYTPQVSSAGLWKSGYFKNLGAYAVLDGSTLTFYFDSDRTSHTSTTYTLNQDAVYSPGWYINRTSVTSVVFDASFSSARPTSCYNWFNGMTKLTSVTGIENLKTDEVTSMTSMFYGCSSLTSLDVSGFNTSKVTGMSSMFYGCSGLRSLDVSGFNTANVTGMYRMFYGCSGLTSLDVSGFNTAKVTSMGYMFYNCSKLTSLDLSGFTFNFDSSSTASQYFLSSCRSLQTLTIPASAANLNANACSGVGTQSAPCTLIYPDGFTPEKTSTGPLWYQWKSGYFHDEPYAVFDGSTLTFYCDNKKDSRTDTVYKLNSGNNVPKWDVNRSSVTSVVFDASFAIARPTSCYLWFSSMTNLTTITGIEYLKTDNVTNMGSMFQSCTSLTSLDVSGFNTANVTYMSNMFLYCSGLSSLDVSGFKTANVTNMKNMFYSCFKLTSLDVSGFDTSNVTNMQGMFGSCGKLTSLDLSGFNTSKVTDMQSMFSYCSHLEYLDLSSFTFNFTSSSTSTRYFLRNCRGLQTLIIPSTAGNLYADACSGVGTQAAPCMLVYPAGFTLSTTSEGVGWYTWKGGYFKDYILLGDANGDKDVTVADAVAVVNYAVKGERPDWFAFKNADIDGNGEISVNDLTGIVNLVLGKASSAPSNALFSYTDAVALTGSGNELTLHLNESADYTATQMVLTLPEDCRLTDARMAALRGNGHRVVTRSLGGGRYLLVVYSATGKPFNHSGSGLLRLQVSGAHHGDVGVSGIQMVDADVQTVVLDDAYGIATGLDWLTSDDGETDGDWYNINGVKVKTPQRGVYIKDGQKVARKK